MDTSELLKARTYLVEQFRKELLGPGSEISYPDAEHEIITDLPEVRYSVGILYPQRNPIGLDNDVPDDISEQEENSNQVEDPGVQAEELLEEDGDTSASEVTHGENEIDERETLSLDDEIGLSTQNLPSSMGLTFFLRHDPAELEVLLSFGTYKKTRITDCCLPFTPSYDDYSIHPLFDPYIEFDKEHSVLRLKTQLTRSDVYRIKDTDQVEDLRLIDAAFRLCNQFGKSGFIRVPHSLPVRLVFSGNVADCTDIDGTKLKLTAIKKLTEEGIFAVTLLLVNEATGKYNGLNSIFQPEIAVDSARLDNEFMEYTQGAFGAAKDQEAAALALLYRNKHTYATGHGVSVSWEIMDGQGIIKSDYMPVHAVAQMDFDNHDPQVPDKVFQMKYLSDLDATGKEDKLAALNEIVESYGRWITNPDDSAAPGIEQIAATLSDHHSEAASRHLTQCKEAYRRMKAGLQTLSENDKAYAAFLLANRAMLMQRIHMGIQSRESLPDDPELQEYMAALDYYHAEAYYPGGREPAWRPFQLAFLLMSVNSIVTPELPERDIVDLIWFPTGGGKTEAYLGLTAFTIFYRRMAYPGEYGGTTVIMRYTLRLLASQQFVRAGTLICACEAIRKDSARKKKYPSYDLGAEPITIGLWIGGTHTPNRNTGADDCAEKHLGELNSATAKSLKYAKDRHNKFQILKCPWCGTKLVKEVDSTGKRLVGQWGYEMKDRKHFFMRCPQEHCLFELELPIQVVDEELYGNPPTLLFGTVDKFAMMAWNGAVASFFGSYSENRAPELIIQDELHLISGPLGTMVGLYEAAIAKLCSKKGVRPKIVASTATIRRAKDQCASLYNREVRQFPPPGLDAEDSYFSREASLDEKPGRIYVGVMPAGKTKAMMEVRLISTILQRVHMMPFSDEVKDKFWTLATYFNSLRDLGKCSTLVDDDVKDNIRRMAYRFGRRNGARPTGAASELTSRVSTTQLNDTLDRLEHLTYSEENQKNRKYAIGVLLATNMISVGVDVDRLNIMLLVGQPKLTSEYIQASSRVGRTYPGMAVVLYDGSKSRDRSHYEQFHAYHDSFYKYVEPTGLTPFSKPARDRAMHAVAISLMRLAHGFVADESAAMFDKDLPAVKEVQDYILQRAREINDRMDFPLSDETPAIEQELADFWEKWAGDLAAAGEENFRFGYRYIMTPPSGDARRLIKSFGSGHDQAIDTPTSMRNVDQSIASNIIVWE